MNVHTYVCLPGSLSFCLFVLRLCVSSAVPGTKYSPPWDGALGFPVLPRCATLFNDNMVDQAVAAPRRQAATKVGSGESWLAERPKMFTRFYRAVLTPIRRSIEIILSVEL